jgi:pheromone receptor transcription factor
MQACLNAPEPSSGDANGVDDNQVDSPEDNHAQMPRHPSQHYPQDQKLG